MYLYTICKLYMNTSLRALRYFRTLNYIVLHYIELLVITLLYITLHSIPFRFMKLYTLHYIKTQKRAKRWRKFPK